MLHVHVYCKLGDNYWYTCTVESRDYAPPPPLCMLALGKNREGAYMRDPNISV